MLHFSEISPIPDKSCSSRAVNTSPNPHPVITRFSHHNTNNNKVWIKPSTLPRHVRTHVRTTQRKVTTSAHYRIAFYKYHRMFSLFANHQQSRASLYYNGPSGRTERLYIAAMMVLLSGRPTTVIYARSAAPHLRRLSPTSPVVRVLVVIYVDLSHQHRGRNISHPRCPALV